MTTLLSPLARALGQLDDASSWACSSAACSGPPPASQPCTSPPSGRCTACSTCTAGSAGRPICSGGIGASLLALWLFLPVAAIIGTLYIDRIAAAVERRHYPSLPPARGAPIASQVWDAISIAARILLLNVLALIAALILPGVGLILAWIIGGYAIGRGLFAAVAMRRMPRPAAEALYRRARPAVLTQGCILALAATIPVLNLLIPVIGTAAMVHVLDQVLVAHADRCG